MRLPIDKDTSVVQGMDAVVHSWNATNWARTPAPDDDMIRQWTELLDRHRARTQPLTTMWCDDNAGHPPPDRLSPDARKPLRTP